MRIARRSQTEQVHYQGSVSVHEKDIIDYLRTKGTIPEKVPDSAIKVEYEVPGGGDYSSTALSLNENLVVSWDHTAVK